MGKVKEIYDVNILIDGDYIINQYYNKKGKLIGELKLGIKEADLYSRMLKDKVAIVLKTRK